MSNHARLQAGWMLILREFILPAFIVAAGALTAIMEPRFVSLENLDNLGKQIAPLLIMAVGQAFAIISGGLDLSMAAVASLAGIGGIFVMQEAGMAAGIATMLAIGAGLGFVNGLIIAYIRGTPLIVTLGMLSIAQAFALILSKGVPVYDIPPEYIDLIGYGAIGGAPATVVIAGAALLCGYVLLRHTVFGRYVYAIGSNASAADKSGINIRLFTLMVYVFSGTMAGLCAVVLTAWVGAAQPVAAPNITLEALAAVVLGGVALTGGSGGMRHVFYGVLILGVLSNAMNMVGISAYFQTLAVGLVIILAVVLDRLRRI